MAAQTQASDQRRESTPANYAFGRVLGEGAFAHCVLAKQRSTKTTVAVKIMLKRHVEREGKVLRCAHNVIRIACRDRYGRQGERNREDNTK